jgi:hypothetical protein
MEAGMIKGVYSYKYHLQGTDKLLRNLFLIPTDTPYAPIAKLRYIVEPLDLTILKRTIAAQKSV